MESFLLARCAMEKESVSLLPDFIALPPKVTNSYTTFLHSQDLGKVLKLAKQLGWLKVRKIPHHFDVFILQQLNPQTADGLRSLISNLHDIGDEAAEYAKQYRNFLHPAKCIRENTAINEESGLIGCFFILLAVSAYIEADLKIK